jgi:hypothetical protein
MIGELVAAIPASTTGPQAAIVCTVVVCGFAVCVWIIERMTA